MHQVRGLVQQASAATLRLLEKRVAPHDVGACFIGAVFVDASGAASPVQLLHPVALQQLLAELPKPEALNCMQEAKKVVLASGHNTAPLATPPGSSSNVLCVKDTTQRTVAELRSRQSRLLAKAEGRLMAHDLRLVEAFTHRLLSGEETQRQGEKGVFLPDEVAMYRSIVEELVRLNPQAAVALAMNTKLPSLGSGASAALAALVNLDVPAATLSFLENFAGKDEASAASETSATQIAVRLRNKLWQLREVSADNPARVALRDALATACRFNVDPGVVFPTDAAAIQRWSSQFLREEMWPVERGRVLADIVRGKRLMPRRVSLDCLSNWCLTDLERTWVSALLQEGDETDGTRCSDTAVYRSALACVLKDPKRCLVDSRLLRQYALLLKRGEVEPAHSSFPHFLEECGECHGDGERPEELIFLMPLPSSSTSSVTSPGPQTLMDALLALAPHCGYWRTLLSAEEAVVEAVLAPQGNVQVKVKLPRVHECVEAAMHAARISESPSTLTQSCLPVIFEDEDIVVLNKPPHLATSRHALSCTQLGDATATDVVSLMLASTRHGDTVRGVFRQGQVHRLDTETSGCLVMAKNDCAAASLRHQMGTSAAYSQSSKVYLALCAVIEPDLRRIPLRGVLRDPLDAKICTKYRVVRFFRRSRVALLECRIQQGKKHQIRRHLAAAGLPILQDVEHGGAACTTPLIDRVALHASALTLVHPRTAEVVTFVAPMARDFTETVRQLE
ncbi:putative pseudouridylate synthase-like protein [Trypanosoma rangeli]|uniref:Putative pseudouridylate synthase-like protein n=1 Tax=Trypanosoma rangeli TaxID=5698 RepID=A0A422P4N9_TRYRA|nr:putative pseudouridylate synthase-like protein [Trypanosoma rangeli]RNF12655.1 putative pseudouridylate synthase-like protein [Trypanosoma rangeli]|eukprot:RNF12655.1 putative pseudouridylate synthase-like protein [Trypanosoma rangeli]